MFQMNKDVCAQGNALQPLELAAKGFLSFAFSPTSAGGPSCQTQ